MSYSVVSINWGPNHPAAHGVMRLVVMLLSELIVNIDCHFGLLHRGTEKLIEMRGWLQVVGYFDSLDYVSSIAQEEVFVCSLDIVYCSDSIAVFNRIVILELVRVLNHLLVIGCHLGDIGAVSFILWLFEDSERIFELVESLTGVSMHAICFSVLSLTSYWSAEISDDLIVCILLITSSFEDCIDLIVGDIVRISTINIFTLGFDETMLFGFSGVLFSSIGMSWDISSDCQLYFSSVLYICYTVFGDSFDSCLISVNEMSESLFIILTCITCLLIWSDVGYFMWGIGFCNWIMFSSMELVIDSFYIGLLSFLNFIEIGFGFSEIPNGEFLNVVVVLDLLLLFSNSISSLGFIYLNSFNVLTNGLYISDLVVSIGTIDVVFGEVDS